MSNLYIMDITWSVMNVFQEISDYVNIMNIIQSTELSSSILFFIFEKNIGIEFICAVWMK